MMKTGNLSGANSATSVVGRNQYRTLRSTASGTLRPARSSPIHGPAHSTRLPAGLGTGFRRGRGVSTDTILGKQHTCDLVEDADLVVFDGVRREAAANLRRLEQLGRQAVGACGG